MSFKKSTLPQVNKIKAMCDMWKWDDNEFYHSAQSLTQDHFDMSSASEMIDLLNDNPDEAKQRLKLIISKPN